MSLRQLTGVDAAFLAAERPGNPLHMMGVLVLDPSEVPGGYSFDGVREFLADRLPTLPQLRRRLVEVPGGLARPYWSDVGEVELDYHLRRVAIPAPGGARELAAMAAAMMERSLDRRVPLWEMQVVEGLEGGRIAVLAKLSHAMMDGIAGVKMMTQLISPTPEIPPVRHHHAVEADEVPSALGLVADSVPWLVRQPFRIARAGAGTLRRLASRRSPARRGSQDADPRPTVEVQRSWLNAPLSPYRDIAWCTLSLDAMREVGHAHDATVNDVLLATVSTAVRDYAASRGLLPDFPLVASVPLAVRGDGDDDRANAVSAVSVSLATDLDDPLERMREIKKATRVRKRERGSSLGEDLAVWADVPPPLLFSVLTGAYFDLDLASRMAPLCNLVVSNVPGPPEALYFAGARLEAIYPLGPVFTGLALNVTAIGCGDDMHVGLVACRYAVPELWSLAEALPKSLAELAGRSGVGAS